MNLSQENKTLSKMFIFWVIFTLAVQKKKIFAFVFLTKKENVNAICEDESR